MQTRIPFDPFEREEGELVIETTPCSVEVWHEYPRMLDEPPYFCVNLFLRSSAERRPNAFRYGCPHRNDWSDLEANPDYGASIPKRALIKALGLDQAFVHQKPDVEALGTWYETTGLKVEWFDVFDRFFLWLGGLR